MLNTNTYNSIDIDVLAISEETTVDNLRWQSNKDSQSHADLECEVLSEKQRTLAKVAELDRVIRQKV